MRNKAQRSESSFLIVFIILLIAAVPIFIAAKPFPEKNLSIGIVLFLALTVLLRKKIAAVIYNILFLNNKKFNKKLMDLDAFENKYPDARPSKYKSVRERFPSHFKKIDAGINKETN